MTRCDPGPERASAAGRESTITQRPPRIHHQSGHSFRTSKQVSCISHSIFLLFRRSLTCSASPHTRCISQPPSGDIRISRLHLPAVDLSQSHRLHYPMAGPFRRLPQALEYVFPTAGNTADLQALPLCHRTCTSMITSEPYCVLTCDLPQNVRTSLSREAFSLCVSFIETANRRQASIHFRPIGFAGRHSTILDFSRVP